jgi:hypothetical protein
MDELERTILDERARAVGNDAYAIGYRYRAIRALNPSSIKLQKAKLITSMNEADFPGFLTEYTELWDRGKWYHRFPRGIMPFNSETFPEHLWR